MAMDQLPSNVPAFSFPGPFGPCRLPMQLRRAPGLSGLSLYLMPEGFESLSVAHHVREALIKAPPFWAFCWGGGLGLADFLCLHPETVRGRTVVDFGAGSGIAGLAAARAGATEVIAVDIDTEASFAIRANAAANGLPVPHFLRCPDEVWSLVDPLGAVCLAADICYEETGRHWLSTWVGQGGQALVAETRLSPERMGVPGLMACGERGARTFPDLDEDPQFESVRLFCTHCIP